MYSWEKQTSKPLRLLVVMMTKSTSVQIPHPETTLRSCTNHSTVMGRAVRFTCTAHAWSKLNHAYRMCSYSHLPQEAKTFVLLNKHLSRRNTKRRGKDRGEVEIKKKTNKHTQPQFCPCLLGMCFQQTHWPAKLCWYQPRDLPRAATQLHTYMVFYFRISLRGGECLKIADFCLLHSGREGSLSFSLSTHVTTSEKHKI